MFVRILAVVVVVVVFSLGEVPHCVCGGLRGGVAGGQGGAGHRRVLGAGQGHRWVHEAEEGVSGVPLHLAGGREGLTRVNVRQTTKQINGG